MLKQYSRIFMALLLGLSLQAVAVEYELPDVDGNIQSMEQYRGKWVVVNYWASWCGTCIKELPEMAAMHEANRDKDIVVIGINYEDISPTYLKDFVEQHAIPYPVWNGRPVKKTPLGNVPALPTTYIVDPEGKPVAGQVGIVTRFQLEDFIQQKKAEMMVSGIQAQ